MLFRQMCAAAAVMISVPAFAQGEPPAGSLAGQIKVFEADASEARADVAILEEQAGRTDTFIRGLKVQLETLAADAQGDVRGLIDKLERRLLIEKQQIAVAQTRAAQLENKVMVASKAVASFSDAAQTKEPIAPSEFFGKTADEVFLEPNHFYPPTGVAVAKGKEDDNGLLDRSIDATGPLPGEIAKRVARATSAFLFDRPDASPISGASLSLGEDGTRLGLKFAFVRGGKSLKCSTDENKKCTSENGFWGDQGYQSTWSVGISSEASKKFASLFSGGDDSGLDDNIRLNLGYSRTYFAARQRKDMTKALAAVEISMRTKCLLAKREEQPLISDALLSVSCSGEKLLDWAKKSKDKKVRTAVLHAVWGYEKPVLKLGGSVDAGYKAFSYRNLSSIDPVEFETDQPFGRRLNEEAEFVWELNGHIGGFAAHDKTNSPRVYGALVAEIGEDYDYKKADKGQTICPTVADTVAFTQCTDLNIAPPLKDSYYRVGLEGKLRISGGSLITEFALVPKVTFDLDDNQLGYELPILFVTDKDSNLNAGIRLAGESGGDNPDDFSFGLFLSSAFSID